MIDLNPKSQFRTLMPDHCKAFVDLIAHPAMRVAMNMALNQMMQGGITTKELNGAKKYMLHLGTLADLETTKKFPQKSLQQS